MDVLLVSKPLDPPWNDSGKNWARDIARYTPAPIVHHVMTSKGSEHLWSSVPNVKPLPTYTQNASAFAPAWTQKARTVRRMLQHPCDLLHLCFAPNPTSNSIARAASTLRRRPCVHTVLSVPKDFHTAADILFAQRTVCISHTTAHHLSRAGVRSVEVIPASIPIPQPIPQERIHALRSSLGIESDRPLVVFPGDYEFNQAADTFASAIQHIPKSLGACYVFACRIKTPASLKREAPFKSLFHDDIHNRRTIFLRNVPDIHALLAAATTVVLPAESTYAKMDIPLVLLEALAFGTPIIIPDSEPIRETLAEDPERSGGLVVPPLHPKRLCEAIEALVHDSTLRSTLSTHAQQHVRTHHNSAINCTRYASVYQSLL